MVIDQEKTKVKELINKANFLKGSIDENLLVTNIEHELSQFISFRVEFKIYDTSIKIWYYRINGTGKMNLSNSNRLQSLLDQLNYYIFII